MQLEYNSQTFSSTERNIIVTFKETNVKSYNKSLELPTLSIK